MNDSDSARDAALVNLLKNGNASALDSLHSLHYKKLYSTALRITGSHEDAQEAVQDTFFQLWQKCSQFDSSRGSLIGWLLTIIRHRAIERIRGRQPLQTAHNGYEETNSITVSHSTALDHAIARQLVRVAATNLTEAQRTAITLAYFEGLTLGEIAKRTQTPVGTVKQRVSCGMRAMKQSLTRPIEPGATRQANFPSLLEDIVTTEQLQRRPCRKRDPQQEVDSLRALSDLAVDSADHLIDFFITMPLDLCHAGSGGLSILETDAKGEQKFRWTNLSGKLARFVGGSTPRNFSPCGVTLDHDCPQLFTYPARYFHYFNQIDLPIVEGLVIPFHVGGKTEGTIWIASHDERRLFDSEDVRIMTSLAEFVGCTVHLNQLGENAPKWPKMSKDNG